MAWTHVGYGDILQDGTQGDPVCDVQRFLYILKYYETNIDIDGQFGAGTKYAVEFYQANAHYGALEVDGVVGPATWKAMKGGAGGLSKPDNQGARLTTDGC